MIVAYQFCSRLCIGTADRNQLIEIPDRKTNRIHVRKNSCSRFAEFKDDAILKFFTFNNLWFRKPLILFLFDESHHKILNILFLSSGGMSFTHKCHLQKFCVYLI